MRRDRVPDPKPEPRKPREFWIIPQAAGPDYACDYEVFGDDVVHVREVLPE